MSSLKSPLTITIPPQCEAEISWTLSVLFRHFLGLDYTVKISPDTHNYHLHYDNKELICPNIFFSKASDHWLKKASLPQDPLEYWRLPKALKHTLWNNNDLPIIFGKPGWNINPESIVFSFDWLGTCFFLLSCYEEGVKSKRDEHNRFPAIASLAYQNNFLDRPLVNEYLELVWNALQTLWPGIKRKTHSFTKNISCDLDTPYEYYVKNWKSALRKIGGDVFLRRNLKMAFNSTLNAAASSVKNYQFDPHSKLDWLMDVNEKAGNQMTFFIIAAQTAGHIDGHYQLEEPRIRDLLQRIHQRGHELGLHGSYNSYLNKMQISTEVNRLKNYLKSSQIHQKHMGNRQHYLRWSSLHTAAYLDAAGLRYDSSLSFADHAGFRSGTCFEYPMYDINKRQALSIKQRPLILMEQSILSDAYLGIKDPEQALNLMLLYKKTCAFYKGQFTLLWHNSNLTKQKEQSMYLELIQ